MTLAVLELNDQQLLIQTEAGLSYAEPGFAQLDNSAIHTGEDARTTAWQQPQHSFNQYWRQLNQQPLPGNQKWARHHADIAYAQLKKLLEAVDCPHQLIIAVPGSFSDQQLSLLLGLVSALEVQTVALVDSALASCLNQQKNQLLVELQLQQTVISLVEYNHGLCTIGQQETVCDQGIMDLYQAAAHYISDRLIENYRYDPLHNSEGEQTIYRRLPNWLEQLGQQQQLSISLPSPQGELSLLLDKHHIANLFQQPLSGLNTALEKYPTIKPSFSCSASLIPQLLAPYFTTAVYPQDAAIKNCLEWQQLLLDSPLQRIDSLQINSGSPAHQVLGQPCQASHLLYQHRAYSLTRPLSIYQQDKQLTLVNCEDKHAAVVLLVEDGQLKIIHRHSDSALQLPTGLQPGASLSIAGQLLYLIEVADA